MHFRSVQTLALTTLVALSLTSSVWAAGSHAGGHGKDEEAIGKPGTSAKVSRTIPVEMSDSMRYTPSSIDVKQGETIRIIATNTGKLKHELILGTEKELIEHYEQMKKFPEMEHDDPKMITVAPGGKGEIVWQFTKTGKIHFACLQPGHYEAGMKGFVRVARK